MAPRTPPGFMPGDTAENDRNLLAALIGTPGIVGAADLLVTANGTPNMTVNVAAGAAFIKGTETTYQGVYHVFNDAPASLAIAASDPTNPRIDIVVAQVRDAFYSGASNDFRLVVVTGTPSGTPAAPATPADSIVLARVAVATLVTTVVAGNITDYRAVVGLPYWDLKGAPYKVRAWRSAAFTTAIGAQVVPLDSDNDPNSNFTLGWAAHYTCPVAGWYQVTGRVGDSGAAGGARRYVAIYQNGAEYSRGGDVTATVGVAVTVSDVVICAAGDTLALWVYTSAALILDASSHGTYLAIHYLSS